MTAALEAGALEALARKYRALGVLRAVRDTEGEELRDAKALRDQLAQLAREFPGCLRELDTLGAAEIARREDAAARAAAGAPVEPWMAWIAAYHRLMRATFVIKQAVGGEQRGRLNDEALAALAERAAADAAMPVDVAFVRAVAAPPQGRLGIVVMRALAAHFQTTATEIAATLFPPRRPRPYDF